jgi:hypothetical protein
MGVCIGLVLDAADAAAAAEYDTTTTVDKGVP